MDEKIDNGNWKTKVDIFRGFTRQKFESIDNEFILVNAQLAEVTSMMDEIKLLLAQSEAVKKYKRRLFTALWGFVGATIAIVLKSIFPDFLNK